uniref:NTF2 domain-containing protein n=1 Tax=Araucaria cunninghamii TaxID=56994 RepID=A0A0D6QS95_ARACU
MATPQVIPVVIHTAQVVGNAFVTQYYNVLHQSPQMAYRFYQECSKLGRPGPNGEMLTVTTMEGINEMILSLGYNDCKSVIKTIDAQESYNNGVLVLVTGSLTFKNSGLRLFTQSFFLAPQDKGYFVLNDVFKYLDEEPEQSKQNLGLANGVIEEESNLPLSEPVIKPEPVVENGVIEQSPTPVEQQPVVEEEYNATEERQVPEGPFAEKEAVIEHHSEPANIEVQPAHEAPAVVPDAPKKSYASIVKVMSENAAPVIPVQKPSTARAVPVSSERQATTSTPPKPSSTESSSPTPANETDNNQHPEAEGNGCSIYIRNLPFNATAAQLEEEFKRFGAIKPSGVQVRSKQGGLCYGFVEFEVAASVQSALEASPILIGGRQAFVEEKRPSFGTRPSATRGRPLPGRGGFRNDGVRGRGAYGGRGNGRADFANRDDFGNRDRGSSSGRGGGVPEDSEGYQRVGPTRNGGRGGRRGGMMANNGPRVGSVAA